MSRNQKMNRPIKGPWERLGFRGTPYSAKPLLPTAEDAALHVGRETQAARFQALADCPTGCVMVVSGAGGMGKNSFLNVMQYRIRSGEATVSKRLIPSYKMTTAVAGTTATELARRITQNFVNSLSIEAGANGKTVPTEVRKVDEWLSHEPSVSGGGFNIGGVGFERSFAIPPVAEATLETWCDILELLAKNASVVGSFDGAFICIDNGETLGVDDLTAILMSYRDTIFDIPGIWWIIVGQAHLYSQIEKSNNRVSQRIRGDGIEIPPLESNELHELIERRVQALGNSDAKSPFSAVIHSLLMEASCGQPRYVLMSGDDLFSELIAMLIAEIGSDKGQGGVPASEFRDRMMDIALQAVLKDDQIEDKVVLGFMERRVKDRLLERKLRVSDLVVLKEIADSEYDSVPPGEIENSGENLVDLMVTLEGLEKSDLLYGTEVEGDVHFQLKGDAWLCNHFDLWEEIRPPERVKKAVGSGQGKAARKARR